jgi:hypothetical protein
MSRMISNLLLSLSMVPLAITVFFLAAIGLSEGAGMSEERAFTIASVVLLVFVVVYWTCVWASSFRWTESRVLRTIAAFAASLCVGGLAGGMVVYVLRDLDALFAGGILGSMAAATAWMIFSVLAWRETGKERAERISGAGGGFAGILLCPNCGYNMTGLIQARCPECGTEYTLDVLLAANAERVEPERELRGTSM